MIFDVSVELDLELMGVIRSDLFDAERQLFNDVIDKFDRVGFCVFVVNLEALTRVASSIAAYWKRRIFSTRLPMKVSNSTSIWI